MRETEAVETILAKLTGKKLVSAEVDGQDGLTLGFEGGLSLVVNYDCYEDGIPNNAFLTVNGHSF